MPFIRSHSLRPLTYYIVLLFLPLSVFAQEEQPPIYYSKKYLDLNIHALEQSQKRIDREQHRLLKKLKKKEARLAHKLQKEDSASFARYQRNELTYDSINNIKEQSADHKHYPSQISDNPTIDTLRGVSHFLNKTTEETAGLTNMQQLDALQQKSAHSKEVSQLINQRTDFLKSLSANSKSKISIKSILKQNYYSGEKVKSFKDIAEEPSKAEDMALEYLMGTKGFSESLKGSQAQNSNSIANASVSDLEKMGFQTKRQLAQQLQSKFGDNLGGVQENISGQIKDYQQSVQELKDTKQGIVQAKNKLRNMKNDKLDFIINPMRGEPFLKRLEHQYNWQTRRATLDGQPATLSLSYMVGFKHTPKLTYGLGLAGNIGLGHSWNRIKFSFEGLGLRSFASWEWQYGIGVYAGYERTYKNAALFDKAKNNSEELMKTSSPHNRNTYSDAVLLGLIKKYKINDKWNGSIQVLYDMWWKEKGLRNPVLLRFVTIKK